MGLCHIGLSPKVHLHKKIDIRRPKGAHTTTRPKPHIHEKNPVWKHEYEAKNVQSIVIKI